jgi:hypothetical protein
MRAGGRCNQCYDFHLMTRRARPALAIPYLLPVLLLTPACGGGSSHTPDAAPPDAALPDAAPPDAAPPDAALPDALVSLNPKMLYLASHPPSEIDLYLAEVEPNPF